MRKLWRKYRTALLILLAVVAVVLWDSGYFKPPPPGDMTANYAQVEDRLYVGARVNEPPPGTQAVLCLSFFKDPYSVKVARWRPIEDGGPAPSLDWLREQVDFIAAQRAAGRQVYVHCDAGMNRAPMVTVAYLMYEHHLGRDDALAFLRQRRPGVGPNKNFMALLLQWEKALGTGPGTRTAEQTPQTTQKPSPP
jgi:hypothetical protein